MGLAVRQASTNGLSSSSFSPISIAPIALSAPRSRHSQCQFRDFAFLTQMPVDTMLLYRHAEHLAGGGAVDVLAFGEHLLPPLFPGEPGDDAGFDG